MRSYLLIIFLLISLNITANEKAVVKKIIDGDTITVVSNGKDIKVRLIGIDAPESNPNSKARIKSGKTGEDITAIIYKGKKAASYLKSILRKGDTVNLEFDLDKYDKHGRTLAYVYLPDGRMLNELIVSAGYAVPLTIPPNVKYKDRFIRLYNSAQENKKGLWSDR